MPALKAPVDVPASAETRRVAISSRRQAWLRHRHILPSFIASLLICAWFVTWGDWNFFEREEFCGFYDAQARSIIAGHLDVPRAAIGSEAFIFEGKIYGYFGIGPALLRLPLVLAFNNMDGRWSRSMMMIACTINLVCAYRILRIVAGEQAPSSAAQRVIESLFILCAGIGSTDVFLVARSFTFHEAIMWGGAFALLFTWALLEYFARPRCSLLLLAALFAFMSLHSRATAGAGAVLVFCVLIGLLTWRAFKGSNAGGSTFGLSSTAKPLLHACIAGLAVIVIVGSYLALNYAKFRTFDGVPLKYYEFYIQNPHHLEVTGGRQIHPENIPTAIATYFGVHGLLFDAKFPWLLPSRDATFVGSPAITAVEGFSTFPVSMPALLLLAVIGCRPLLGGWNEAMRRLRLPAIGLLLGGGIVFATVAITERYLHDLYPALIVCAAVGVWRIGRESYARGATVVLAVLSLASVACNCSLALANQRLDVWGMGGIPPAKKAAFKEFQRSIYRFFNGTRKPAGAPQQRE
jgi:hypothetical protein